MKKYYSALSIKAGQGTEGNTAMPEMTASVLEFELPPMIEETPKRKIRIVLADDHPIVRDGLKKMLALESDFEVVGE